MTVESIEDTRNETSSNQEHNPDIIQFIAKLGNYWRVVRNGMIRAGHAKTESSTQEEASKRHDVRHCSCLVSRLDGGIQYCSRDREHQCSKQMRVDVDRLIVKIAKTGERLLKRC